MTQRYFDDEDLAMLKEVLDANVPSAIDGPWTRRLQKEFAAATEAKYAVAVNSGMSALHACLAAAEASVGRKTPAGAVATRGVRRAAGRSAG